MNGGIRTRVIDAVRVRLISVAAKILGFGQVEGNDNF